MRVKIKSDGTPRGTEVVMVDDSTPFPTTQPLAGVTEIEWRINLKGKAEAKITVFDVELDAEAPEGTIQRFKPGTAEPAE